MYYQSTNQGNITREKVLALTTELDIFQIVLDEVVLDGVRKYTAPYREDNNPKCYLEVGKTGALHFVDFADPLLIRKDCFGFIGACYNLTLDESLRFIDNELSLGICSSYTEVVTDATPKPKYKLTKRRNNNIGIAPRKFEVRDRDFWYPYGITREQLTSDGVIPISCYRFLSRKGDTCTITPYDVCYAYTEFDDDRKKIYRPMGSSEQKWLTNCSQNDIGGIEHLDTTCEYVVITKSYKDYRVLKNEGINAVWFQNEGMIPSVDFLQFIHLFKTVYIWFDNDQAGIATSIKARKYFEELGHKNVHQVLVPIPYRKKHNVKDPSDLRKHNPEKLKEIIHTKILNYA